MEELKSPKTRVCFFDSGIGGLNLLKYCAENIEGLDCIYYADNFNMPYGTKSKEGLLSIMDAHFERIIKMKPQAVVLACNTVTAICAKHLRQKYEFPIVGIQPAVKPAAKSGDCVVLATPMTAESDSICELVRKYGENRTRVVACPDLAKYIEKNVFNLREQDIKRFLPKLDCSSVVLGCTHYSYIKSIVEKMYNCPVFDGIEGTANHLAAILGKILHRTQNNKIMFFNGNTAQNRAVYYFYKEMNGANSL